MVNRSYEAFLIKVRAAPKVAQAIKKGILTKPFQCSKCQSTGRIEGHHSNYNKPLEVIWLCVPCHNKIHLYRRQKMKNTIFFTILLILITGCNDPYYGYYYPTIDYSSYGYIPIVVPQQQSNFNYWQGTLFQQQWQNFQEENHNWQYIQQQNQQQELLREMQRCRQSQIRPIPNPFWSLP